MDEPRLPASPQGAVSGTDERSGAVEASGDSAVVERVDRSDMLPRLHGVEFKLEDEELLLLLAEQFYPDLTHIDQIENWQERRGWLILCTQILKGQEATIRYAAETFSKVFQPSVDAQVADTLRKGAAEELERQERRAREIEIFKANLILLAQKGVLSREEWELEKTERITRLILEAQAKQQETEEKRTRTQNRNLREKMVMGMATIIFVCAFVAFIVGLVSGEPWIIGTSGITGIGALVAAVKLLSNENNPPPPPAPPGEPPDATAS